ncbi:MAG: cellulase family glycosylhydrolase [Ruminococcus sp.]|nr:cellulase family glycosylhydrolase [Ruminococcus sp.]
MKIKTITGSLLSASLMVTSFPVILPAVASGNNNEMRDISTMELVQDMGIGINLGNTFESSGDWIAQWGDGTPNSYETAWGSPTVTKELIQGYADAGFGVVRVPVAWSNMMANDGSYKINPDYMSRVQQVVDWILDEDMYVILNLHWDGGWLEKLPEDHDNVMAKYSAIWEQVSAEFSMYGDHLMFEAQNEELGWGTLWNQWSGSTDGKAESYGYVNEVNQTFVNIVRNSGGNNPERHLLISGYNTDIKLTCDPLFKMPDDPAGRMALSVHYYTPAGFAILEEDADWGKASSTWGTEAEIAELERNMDSLKNTFTEKGIPVIIGEYGCPKKNKEPESVRKFITSVCEASVSRNGICPVLWDITDLHYDRTSFKMTDEELGKQLLEIRDKYFKKDTPDTISGDVNKDGKFTVADAVMLGSWILQRPDAELADWESGDISTDGIIDIFDLCLMRKMLLKV